MCLLGLAVIGLVHAAGAAELDPVLLRGSNAAPALLRPAVLVPPPAPTGNVTFEVGTRYWLSFGSLTKDLFDDPRASSVLNSRLTYDGLRSGSFEGFGRIDMWFGTFVKGNAGFAGFGGGALQDEDFPPNLSPYSSTMSQQSGGRLTYGSIDIGQIAYTTERVRASVFGGFGYLAESANAYGCNQTAGNPFVCAPAIPTSVLAITEDTHWQFMRLGLLGEVRLLDRLKLAAEVAWLPFVQLAAQDTHWLRLGSTFGSIASPIPEHGSGSGVQIETILSYQVSDRISLGLGGRYWLLQTRGSTDFEGVIVGLSPIAMSQPLNFVATRYGAFAQGSYRLGPF
jgi:hypothetical protein